MDIEQASMGFSAMGSEARLAVLLQLVRAGTDGLTVGDIQLRTNMPGATLNHHLKSLSTAQLIVQEKHGRSIISKANFDHLDLLASYILKQCCADQSDKHKPLQKNIAANKTGDEVIS